MKHILFFFSFISVIGLNAQRQGSSGRSGQGNSMRQMPQGQRAIAFEASNAAGIAYYDVNKTIKRLKIKGDNKLKFAVEKSINNYNQNVKKIALQNKHNFDTLNVYMNDVMKSLQAGGDRSKIQNIRGSVQEKIRPVRRSVMKEESKLNDDLNGLLNEKQFKKWKNYQIEVKASLRPDRSNGDRPNRNTSGNSQRGFNQQGGQRMQGAGPGAGGGRG
ncbi:hypothetical protein [Seonamhaeicola maritimus]|uniref:hypothetical protein n=1 Tax=Seonamhaeicola maritimus TaxID=2591822 RepID=UPI002494E527|nr:hypothetical protein [Seonamhaeicola maritimus]